MFVAQNLGLDFPTILILMSTVLNVMLGILIYSKRRDEFVNKIYIFNILCIVWWSVMIVCYRFARTHLLGWTMSLYVAPTFIASSFLYFSFYFPEVHPRIPFRSVYLWIMAVLNVGIVALVLTPGAILVGTRYVPNAEKIIYFGHLYPLYALYISGFFSLGLLILARKWQLLEDQTKRRQLLYLLLGYLFASMLAMVTNLLLPYVGIFFLNWLGQVLTVFMVLPVTYAIFKHRLFDVKVIATELITITLWLFLLGRFLLDTNSYDRILDSILLLVVFVVGWLLIRSVDNEVAQREKIEELSRNKSEFMSFASHEIRNPITAIRGYASLMADGTLGEISDPVRDAVDKIQIASSQVIMLIAQFLDASKLELGQISYDLTSIDLNKAVLMVSDGFAPHAVQQRLWLKKHTEFSNLMVRGDEAKLKSVVGNLLDNAIKYTKEGGIEISVEKHNGMGRITIADTGAGIPRDVLPQLFKKFSRADAKKMNLHGTGLGLYLGKQFIEGMGGRLWAESPGEGKGSRFIIELPAV